MNEPAWADWTPSRAYSVGIEEEVMLLEPDDFSLAHRGEDILPRIGPALLPSVSAETHDAALELATVPHSTAHGAATEAASLRKLLAGELAREGLRAACAGTHPFASWKQTKVSNAARYQLVYESMRELARREPTFALHVHVGIRDPESAIAVMNRLRAHLPLLLALSANSPFWQGRDTGLASTRIPIFQAFPRVGIPRAFHSYGEYVETVDQLLRCDAFPEPTFLWWDVRVQPALGTVEVRIMDAQTTASATATLAAMVQTIAHLELEEGYHDDRLIDALEILQENRFIAARDGMESHLIDPVTEQRVPATELLEELVEAGRPHAEQLGCDDAFVAALDLARENGPEAQRAVATRSGVTGVAQWLAGKFAPP